MAFDFIELNGFIDGYGNSISPENEAGMNFIKELKGRLSSAQEEINNLTTELANSYPESEVRDKDGVSWKDKYDNLGKLYRERFFSGRDAAIEDQRNDISKDDSSPVTTFEALFKDREGDYK